MEFPGSDRQYLHLYPAPSNDDFPEKVFLEFLSYYYDRQDDVEAQRLINLEMEDDSEQLSDDELHMRDNLFDVLRVRQISDTSYRVISDVVDEIESRRDGPEHIFTIDYDDGDGVNGSELWLPVGRSLIYIVTEDEIFKINRSDIGDYLYNRMTAGQQPDQGAVFVLCSYRRDPYSEETIDEYLS
jgi:hypothetical protein